MRVKIDKLFLCLFVTISLKGANLNFSLFATFNFVIIREGYRVNFHLALILPIQVSCALKTLSLVGLGGWIRYD